VNLLMERPVRSSVGLLVIMAGIPLYGVWRRREVNGSMTAEQPSSAGSCHCRGNSF
jgi:hypothetical protein